MTFCDNCGTKIEPGEKFCGKCGAPVSGLSKGGSVPAEAPIPRPAVRRKSHAKKIVAVVVTLLIVVAAGVYISDQISASNAANSRELSSLLSKIATQCSTGYVYSGGVCCPSSAPYYDPSTNLCYQYPPQSTTSTYPTSYNTVTTSTYSLPSTTSSYVLPSTTTTSTTPQGYAFTLQITSSGNLLFTGCIDGSDWLYLKGSSAWIVHRNFALPGWQKECVAANNSTGTWQPSWYTNTSRLVQFTPTVGAQAPNGTASSVFTLPQSIVVTGFTIVNARESVTMVQTPSASNGNEAIILFNDDFDLGAAIYTISIQFTGG